MTTIEKLTFLLLFFLPLGLLGQDREVTVASYVYKDSLEVDFYSLDDNRDQQRPLLLLMHGGGFASGKKDGDNELAFCKDMAKRGYAVASMEYRLTRKNDPFNCDCATENKMQSFISGSEDLTAALEFLNQNGSLPYDRNNVILAGSSAGAETVLHLAFMRSDYRFKHIPYIKISGLISFAGAVSDASYISKKNALPTLFIHGKKDDLVPFGSAPHHFCSEDRSGYLLLDGPKTISEHLLKYDTSFVLAYNIEGNHDWANIAYGFTDLVDGFIKDAIIDKKNIQTFVELMNPENSEVKK